jgi:hypothetical protein
VHFFLIHLLFQLLILSSAKNCFFAHVV